MGRGPDTRSLSPAFRASKMAEFPSDQTDTTEAVGLSSRVRGTETGGKGPIPRDEGGGSGSAELSGPPGSGPP